MSAAVKHYIEKSDKSAVPKMVDKQMKKVIKVMNEQEVDDLEAFEETLKLLKNRGKPAEEEAEIKEILAEPFEGNDMEVEPIEDFDDLEADHSGPPVVKRGRGRGRGAGSGRGRGSAKRVVEESEEESFEPPAHAKTTTKKKCYQTKKNLLIYST